MAATKVNLNGINELDLNLFGTSIASTVGGVTTVTQTPAIATSSTVGVVKPDNNTIQVQADGTLVAAGPAPSFVQGASNTSSASTMLVSLSGISLANSLILHVRCGNSTPPTFSGIGNAYVVVQSVYNSFWTTGCYTYICYGALATTESITFTGLVGNSACILAEYTPASAFESATNNSVSANAATSNTLNVTSTKNYERAIFFFSCGAFSGQTPNQTQRVPTSGSSTIILMDAPCPNSGTTITGTVTSGAMNQAAMTGFLLSGLGQVQSVGLSMPSDFTVTGSPVLSKGVFQVTGGVTKSGVQQNAYNYATDTGAVNAYAVTLSPAPSLVIGSEVIFKAATTNTGAATLTVNGTTYPLKKNGTSALASGDILINQIVSAFFDGTNFQTLIPGSGGGGGGGVTSLNTLTGALSLVAGSNVTITPSGTNVTIASSGGSGSNAVLSGKTIYTSAQRTLGTVYQNTSAYPIVVMYFDNGTTAPVGFSDTVNPPTKVVTSCQTYSSTAAQPIMFLVMPGNYYKITGVTWGGWLEYAFNTGTFTSSGDLNTGSRVLGTVYQNTGSGAMFVQVMTTNTTATNVLSVVCDSSTSPTTTTFSQQTLSTAGNSIFFLVPQGYYYKVSCTATPTVAHWYEYSSNIPASASANLIASPQRRQITASNANPVAAWSVFNNTGKTKFIQTGFTNGSTGTAICNSDEVCPPFVLVWAAAGVGGSQIRGQAGFHQPNEFWFTKQDGGTCTASYWLEYTLG